MDALWANGTMTQEKFDSFATLHERLHIANNTPMRVVLDTNCLIMAISARNCIAPSGD